MLNEWDEFKAYTQKVEYIATSKGDTTYLDASPLTRFSDLKAWREY